MTFLREEGPFYKENQTRILSMQQWKHFWCNVKFSLTVTEYRISSV